MQPNDERLQLTVFFRAARWRWQGAMILKGLVISLAVGGLTCLGSAALADRFQYAPAWITALRLTSAVIVALTLGFFLVRPGLRRIPDAQMARFVEEKNPGLQDRLVSAVEFAKSSELADSPLVRRLIRDAAQRTASIHLDTIVPRARLQLYAAMLVVLLAVLGWLLMAGPDYLWTALSKLYAPWSEAANANPYVIVVQPGTVRVPKGSDQMIVAWLRGFEAEHVQVHLKPSSQPSWLTQTMELDQAAHAYRHWLLNLQEDVTYVVQAGPIRSPEFTLKVADLARVERLDLIYQFPAYTGLPAKRVEDGGDIVALKGTRVQVIANLNRPAEAATAVLANGSSVPMHSTGPHRFAGQIIVEKTGTYRIDLTSAGETYTGSSVHDIVALEDGPPLVTIEKPGRDLSVTSIQEVFTQVRAEDDYGIVSLELHFSVNGGEEQAISLYRMTRSAPKQITGTHTFFLEEYDLHPGDVLSYYATARDSRPDASLNRGASDIYFLEIRPFDRTYRQAQQNAGTSGSSEQGALTRRQKDIIAATWRVTREHPTQSPQEFTDNLNTITLSQEGLRHEVAALADRIRRRLGASLDEQPEFKQLTEHLERAAAEMEAALRELRARKPKEALLPQQRALQQLLHAEATFREIQVAFGADGGDDRVQADDLADLFELELDKTKNQYETLQRDRGQQHDRQMEETLRQLQELARRQQKEAEEHWRRARPGAPRTRGGRGSQQQLLEEAQQLARHLERLSRERHDERLAETSRQLRRALEQMQQAQSSGSSAEAAARAQRAAEHLEAARQQLQTDQETRYQEAIRQLRERAAQAAQQQREIVRQVDELARTNQSSHHPSAELNRRLAQRKEALAQQLEDLGQDLESAARDNAPNPSVAQMLSEAARAVDQHRLPENIRQGIRLLENHWYDQARQREREIDEDLNHIVRMLQAAEGRAARRSDAQRWEEALSQARRLADDLESLYRRLQDQMPGRSPFPSEPTSDNRHNQRQQGQPDQPGRSNRSPGTLPSRDQTPTQPDRRWQESPEAQHSRPQDLSGTDRPWRLPNQGEEFPLPGGRPGRSGDRRQRQRELSERLREAQALRRHLDRDLAQDLDRLIRQMRHLDDERLFTDPEEIARLKTELIDPLRELELELRRRWQAALGQTGPRLADETSVPESYRKLVEDYYKRLAKSK